MQAFCLGWSRRNLWISAWGQLTTRPTSSSNERVAPSQKNQTLSEDFRRAVVLTPETSNSYSLHISDPDFMLWFESAHPSLLFCKASVRPDLAVGDLFILKGSLEEHAAYCKKKKSFVFQLTTKSAPTPGNVEYFFALHNEFQCKSCRKLFNCF